MMTTTAPPLDSSLTACHQSASAKQGTAVHAKDAAESGPQNAVGVLPCSRLAVTSVNQDGLKAASAADPLPGRCRQPQAGRKRRQKRRDPSTGVTPEHMLYWVSQADVAEQLRCTDAVCSAAAVLLPEAALAGDSVQEACSSVLPNPLSPTDQQCAAGCQQQTSRTVEVPCAACTPHCIAEPAILQNPFKRRQCL